MTGEQEGGDVAHPGDLISTWAQTRTGEPRKVGKVWWSPDEKEKKPGGKLGEKI